jgi:multidrug efflux pump subunit AcrA (membrane-fusion protein)
MGRSRKRRVREYVIVGFIVILVIAGFFTWRALRSSSGGEITYRTQAVEKMTLTSSVSGVGNISLSSTAAVNPGVSGTVSGLEVNVGDTVKEGQLLFTVVNDQLDLDVVNAQNSYNNAVAGVERAKLSVLQAEQSLKNLKKQKADQATSTTATVPPATTTTTHPPSTDTSSTLPTTTTTSGASSTSSLPPVSSTGFDSFDESVSLAAAAAQTSGQTTASSITTLDIDVAKAQVTSAELSLTAAETQVTSASLALQQAKVNAAKRQVLAPMDGVVTQVNAQDGDSLGSTGSNSNQAAASSSSSSSSSYPIVITNTDALEVTVSLAEADIVSVKMGQKATFTFDALPDVTLTGKVTNIDNSGTVNQGVVSYNVTLVPDTTAPSVKGGMTVTANIITEVKADVLAVPIAAVKTSTSGSYVQILESGKPVDQTVEVGLSTDSYMEITSGLTEGQEVVTQTVDPNASTTTTVRGRTGGGIGGGAIGIPGF